MNLPRLKRKSEEVTLSERRLMSPMRIVALVIFAAFLLLLVYLRAWPPFAIVMSDSMEPTMDVGDVVVMGQMNDIPEVGDIVAIKVPGEIQEKFNYPPEVVHRIVKITPQGNIRTQGDNREDVDPFTMPADAVQKRMVKVIPGAGKVASFLFSPFGFLWLGLGVLLFFVLPLYDFQKERMEVERIELSALDQLRTAIDDVKLSPETAGAQRLEPEVERELEDMKGTLGELVGAVGEYGHHLRSHTSILKSMSEASQSLAAVVGELQVRMQAGEPSTIPMVVEPRTEVAAEAHEVEPPSMPATPFDPQVLPTTPFDSVPADRTEPGHAFERVLHYLGEHATDGVGLAIPEVLAARLGLNRAQVVSALVELAVKNEVELDLTRDGENYRYRMMR